MKKYTLAMLSVFACSGALAGSGAHSMDNGMNNNVATITTVVEPVADMIVTVEQIPNMMDNQNVMMTGYIIESLGDKMYIFQDSTGQINVEIEPVVLGEMVIMPDTKMKIKGEVDKGDDGEMDVIEVDYISAM